MVAHGFHAGCDCVQHCKIVRANQAAGAVEVRGWIGYICTLTPLTPIPREELLRRFAILSAVLLLVGTSELFSQAENVPVNHPVYVFLKRMEVKGMIGRYHDAVLPISRREVGHFLSEVNEKRNDLSRSEQGWLDDYLSEFKFDITGSASGFQSLIPSDDSIFVTGVPQTFSNREKFLYATVDSSVAIFVNGLLDADARRISGDALGSTHAEYLQAGGRIRGTILGKLGFYAQMTNAQFWGSRELLERDPIINQSYGLRTSNAQNFDFTEGYARYDAGIVSLQIGRERVLWGVGTDQRMVLSDNIPAQDFVRADISYKGLKYTFMHAWLLGTRSSLQFTLPFDPTTAFVEPVNADKYFAAHRIGLILPGLFEIGFQEMYIYSNRSVDLAYLNPFVLMESAQRARGERDNGFWAFDMQTKFLKGFELNGTMLFDDIHIPGFFEDQWYNRYGFQLGLVYADPLTVPNTTLMVEYTRIEPWVFSHNRSRDDSYTSNGAILGPRIGPNADSWFFRLDWLPLRNLYLSARVFMSRKGNNIYDPSGNLVKNVGGDVFAPHRDTDPETKIFLDGLRENGKRYQFFATYELINQIWLDARFEHETLEDAGLPQSKNTTFGVRLRTEF